MKKVILAALAVFFALVAPAIAQTVPSGRTIVFPLENPPSADTVLQPARFSRVALGSLLLHGMGLSTSGAGQYANCTTAPGSGLFVTVAPTISGSDCGLYQVGPSDTNPIPVGYTPQLPVDPTVIVLQALQNSTSSPIGPLTAPGVGLSVYWLLEAQIQTTDVNVQQRPIYVPSNGDFQNQSVPIQRQDAIAYQLKQGVAASGPTEPSADSGWVPIAYVLVAHGTTQITTGMISVGSLWSGFGSGGSGGSVSSVTASSPLNSTGGSNPNISCTGCFTVSGSQTVAGTTTWSALSPFAFSSTNGVDFTSAANGAFVAWIFNANNSPTSDIVDFQKNSSNVLQVLNGGGVLSQGAFTSANTTPLVFSNTAGGIVTSAAMGSATAFTLNGIGSPFTGDIADFQNGGVTQASVSNGGIVSATGLALTPTSGPVNITSAAASNTAFNFNDIGSTAGQVATFQNNGVNEFTVGHTGNVVATGSITAASGVINGGTVVPLYKPNGNPGFATAQCVHGTATAGGASTVITFSGTSIFTNYPTSIDVTDSTSNTVVAPSNFSGVSTSGFTLASTNGHVYFYMVCGY